VAELVKCEGTVTENAYGGPVCSTGWVAIDSAQTELLVAGGYDAESFDIAFGGFLLLWVAGLGIGLVASIIRKAKR